MNEIQAKLRGTGVALVTPFNQNDEIDFDALGKVIDYTIQGGVEYLVSLGTTGESVTLSSAEKEKVLQYTIERIAGRVPLVAGCGGNNTKTVIADIKKIPVTGVDAILSVSPYYNKPNQEGIFRHYDAIATESPLPVILYNVPSRTGAHVNSATTLKLAVKHKNIIATKEASGNLDEISEIIANRPDGFLVISGDDALTLPITNLGGDGVISVIANAYPAIFSEMVRKGLSGEAKRATELHFKILDVIHLIFKDGSPGGVKSLLKAMGICNDFLRLPLAPVNEKLASQINAFQKNVPDQI